MTVQLLYKNKCVFTPSPLDVISMSFKLLRCILPAGARSSTPAGPVTLTSRVTDTTLTRKAMTTATNGTHIRETQIGGVEQIPDNFSTHIVYIYTEVSDASKK